MRDNMLTKRIIPCLDVKNGKVVKGINFVGLKEVGDPVTLAKEYYEQGADELVFLDITATHEQRDTMVQVVQEVASEIYMPFTVGGGLRSIEDIKRMLRAGADKVSLNSAAVKDPNLIAPVNGKITVNVYPANAGPEELPKGDTYPLLIQAVLGTGEWQSI